MALILVIGFFCATKAFDAFLFSIFRYTKLLQKSHEQSSLCLFRNMLTIDLFLLEKLVFFPSVSVPHHLINFSILLAFHVRTTNHAGYNATLREKYVYSIVNYVE